MMREATITPNRQFDRNTISPVTDRFVKRIEQFVRLRTGSVIQGLHVEIDNQEVVLTGRTTTWYSKQLATHAALELLDDQSLSNCIEVN